MLLRLIAITTKEVRQLARDRLTFGMIIGIPLMQILLFGYAINFDVRDLNAAVVDEAKTSHSRALVADLAGDRRDRPEGAQSEPAGPAPAHGKRRNQRRHRHSRGTSSDDGWATIAPWRRSSSTARSR